MSDKDAQILTEKLQYGLALAERRMLEEKALHGQDIVICNADDTIERIPASEAIKKIPSVQ
ncbi:MAG: hypothetical protein IKR83_05960 [Bacteroidales bacterium]|jgi:hypothetical protein|nr:hypothetical protein [Bacteroidales bacterium]